MARKLTSMFKNVVPRPGSVERPVMPPPAVTGLGEAGTVREVKAGPSHDEIAKLAYERWLETGGGAVENWAWAEAELRRRS